MSTREASQVSKMSNSHSLGIVPPKVSNAKRFELISVPGEFNNLPQWARDAVAPSYAQNAQVVTVTPEVAKFFLMHNPNNRSVKPQYVTKLKGIIERGEFTFNAESISFNSKGHLANGQHRLWACVESGMPISVLLVTGVEPDAQQTMDSGVNRTLRDHLEFHNGNYPNGLDSTLRYLFKYRAGVESSNRVSARPTAAQAIQLFDENPNILRSREFGVRVSRQLKVHMPLVWFLHYVFATVDDDKGDPELSLKAREDADHFFDKLATGIGLEEGEPIAILRHIIERESRKSATAFHRISSLGYHALIVKTWNHYRNGVTSIDRIMWRGGKRKEKFPKPI